MEQSYFWEGDICWGSQNAHTFWNKFNYHVCWSLPRITLKQFVCHTVCLLKICFNIMLCCKPKSPKWPSFGIYDWKFVCGFNFHHFRLSFTFWCHPSDVWWRVQIIKIPFISILCFGICFFLLLLVIILQLLWQFRRSCHLLCFVILRSVLPPHDLFILHQLNTSLQFSFLQSIIILIISTIYPGFWPWRSLGVLKIHFSRVAAQRAHRMSHIPIVFRFCGS